MMNNSNGDLVVKLATSQEDYDFVTKLAKGEQWFSVGAHSIAHMGPVLRPGFFIGYLNGQRIGHVCGIKYGQDDAGSSVYYVGFYIVEKAFRGKGYGLKIWNTVWESLPKDSNKFLDGVMGMVPKYEKMMGLRKEWSEKEYLIPCSKIVESFQQVLTPAAETLGIAIKPIDEVDFQKLSEYDSSVFGFPRREFLKKWITIPESLGWVATDSKGGVIGYTVIRHSVMDKHQIVGPLFSDDINIARILLYTTANAAINQRAAEKLEMFVPVSVNHEAAELIEKEIGCESTFQEVRMYTMGIPPQLCWKKVIAITSPGLG